MSLPLDAGIPDGTLPGSVYRYQIDVTTREAPTVRIAGASGSREVSLIVSHPDVGGGKFDVVAMTVWGDVDPNFHPCIEQAEVNSTPFDFAPKMPIVLSAGAGAKVINVKVYFRSGRTMSGSWQHMLDDGTPHVTVLRQPYRDVLLPTDTVTFGWSCSHAFTQIYVGLTDDYQAGLEQCSLITSGVNVSGTGSWSAGQYIETSFTHANALVADPDLDDVGQRFVKVFVQTAKGLTS